MTSFITRKLPFCLCTFLLTAGCEDSKKSSITILQEVVNPTKTEKAVLFLEEDDEEIGNSLQVEVVCYSCKIENKKVKNNFAADTISPNGRGELINMSWTAPDSLVVNVDYRLRPFLKEPKGQKTFIAVTEY